MISARRIVFVSILSILLCPCVLVALPENLISLDTYPELKAPFDEAAAIFRDDAAAGKAAFRDLASSVAQAPQEKRFALSFAVAKLLGDLKKFDDALNTLETISAASGASPNIAAMAKFEILRVFVRCEREAPKLFSVQRIGAVAQEIVRLSNEYRSAVNTSVSSLSATPFQHLFRELSPDARSQVEADLCRLASAGSDHETSLFSAFCRSAAGGSRNELIGHSISPPEFGTPPPPPMPKSVLSGVQVSMSFPPAALDPSDDRFEVYGNFPLQNYTSADVNHECGCEDDQPITCDLPFYFGLASFFFDQGFYPDPGSFFMCKFSGDQFRPRFPIKDTSMAFYMDSDPGRTIYFTMRSGFYVMQGGDYYQVSASAQVRFCDAIRAESGSSGTILTPIDGAFAVEWTWSEFYTGLVTFKLKFSDPNALYDDDRDGLVNFCESSYSTPTPSPSPSPSPTRMPIPSPTSIVTPTPAPTATSTPYTFHHVCGTGQMQGSCVVRSGPGSDECYSDSQCAGHRRCSASSLSCYRYPSPGVDECTKDEQCGQTECNEVGQCMVVPGQGINRCRDDKDCVHYVCKGGSCFAEPGQGPSTCSPSGNSCNHTECREGECVRIDEPGPDKCSDWTECAPSHRGCVKAEPDVDGKVGVSCQLVRGSGPNTCDQDDDCGHRECSPSFGSCRLFDGEGEDKCEDDGRCLVTHRICSTGHLCREEVGTGPDTCENDSDCGHNTCTSDLLCERVAGKGSDACEDDKSCGGHYACSDGECRKVTGDGPDQCSSPADCGHSRCYMGNCILLEGKGQSDCDNSGGNNCKHNICLDGSCKAVWGEGIDQCWSNKNCIGSKNPGNKQKGNQPGNESDPPPPPSIDALDKLTKFDSRTGDAFFGKNSASVPVIDVYQDLSCGMCRALFENGIGPLFDDYVKAGRVALRFREFPLGMREKEVQLGLGAKCAAAQGKYFSYISEAFFRLGEADLSPAVIAKRLGIDEAKFSVCLTKKATRDALKRDVATGKKSGVSGTPALISGKHTLKGFRDTAKLMNFFNLVSPAKGKSRSK